MRRGMDGVRSMITSASELSIDSLIEMWAACNWLIKNTDMVAAIPPVLVQAIVKMAIIGCGVAIREKNG